MQPKSVWGFLALLAVGAVMVLPGVVLAAPAAANVHLSLSRESPALLGQPGQSWSYNWAGYANYNQPTGGVTKVSGAWVQPAVTCPATGTQYAAFWVGIDGYSSATVEQTGTLAICHAGVASYYAWWELYPTNAIQVITTMTVSPGDHLSASVVFHPVPNDFTMTIKDLTAATMFSVTAAQAAVYAPYALENGAECIIERPAEISSSGVFTLLHLADFGTVTFSSCMSTVSGTSGGVGLFVPSALIYMVGLKSTTTHVIYLASPGGPTNFNRWSFTTTWQGSH